MGEFGKFKEDVRIFSQKHASQGVLKYFYYPDLRAVFLYRLSRWCFLHRLKPLAYFFVILNDFINGVWIGPNVEAGPGLYLGHPRGLMVNPGTKIGSYCTFLNQVTLGGPSNVIGDFVEIGAGAKVISKPSRCVVVGSHSIVGAGAVVTKSCDQGSVLIGVPARVVSKKNVDEWIKRHPYYLSVCSGYDGERA